MNKRQACITANKHAATSILNTNAATCIVSPWYYCKIDYQWTNGQLTVKTVHVQWVSLLLPYNTMNTVIITVSKRISENFTPINYIVHVPRAILTRGYNFYVTFNCFHACHNCAKIHYFTLRDHEILSNFELRNLCLSKREM